MLLNEFFKTFKNLIDSIKKEFENIYKNSNFYEKKISKTLDVEFQYKPSPYLLSSLINYQNKKYRIDELDFVTIWENKSKSKEFKKLNNFFWFFSLDLKSSRKSAQKVISDWINRNKRFKKESWEFDTTAKRIISWLSNHQLSYENSDKEYRLKFDCMIQKQTNHLVNEIKSSGNLEKKIFRIKYFKKSYKIFIR